MSLSGAAVLWAQAFVAAFLVSSPGSFQPLAASSQTAVAARQAAVAAKMHVRPTRPAGVRNGDHEDDGFDRGAPAEQLGADAVQPTAGPAKRTGRRSRRSRKRFDTWRAKQRVSSFKLSESATGVPSGSTAHLLLLQKPEKEQATKFEVLSTCPADEQPVPQLESDTEDPELKGLASLAECKCCPVCGASISFAHYARK